MVRVFISYRRKDAPEEVARLCRRLERRYGRASVFTDAVKIDTGDDFMQEIRASLRRGDVILVVTGPRWVELLHDRARRGELS